MTATAPVNILFAMWRPAAVDVLQTRVKPTERSVAQMAFASAKTTVIVPADL